MAENNENPELPDYNFEAQKLVVDYVKEHLDKSDPYVQFKVSRAPAAGAVLSKTSGVTTFT